MLYAKCQNPTDIQYPFTSSVDDVDVCGPCLNDCKAALHPNCKQRLYTALQTTINRLTVSVENTVRDSLWNVALLLYAHYANVPLEFKLGRGFGSPDSSPKYLDSI